MGYQGRNRHWVIAAEIDQVEWELVIRLLTGWANLRESRVVCACNVHSVVTAISDKSHRSALATADLVVPDGGPVARLMRILGARSQERIDGPQLMARCCGRAAQLGIPIFLLGGSEETLLKLATQLISKFPQINIVGTYSPPYRELLEEENIAIEEMVNSSRAGFLWVGLGCPKQEKWMQARAGRIRAVMVGVGAAFDYHSGQLKRAPRWMQQHSLEWLYRVIKEPRRLWKRYLITNTLFIFFALRQLIAPKRNRKLD